MISEKQFNAIVQDICELPDYSSPEDQPNVFMCTQEELRVILINNGVMSEPLAAPAPPEPPKNWVATCPRCKTTCYGINSFDASLAARSHCADVTSPRSAMPKTQADQETYDPIAELEFLAKEMSNFSEDFAEQMEFAIQSLKELAASPRSAMPPGCRTYCETGKHSPDCCYAAASGPQEPLNADNLQMRQRAEEAETIASNSLDEIRRLTAELTALRSAAPRTQPPDTEMLEAVAEDGLLVSWDKDHRFNFSQVVHLMSEFAENQIKEFFSPSQKPDPPPLCCSVPTELISSKFTCKGCGKEFEKFKDGSCGPLPEPPEDGK